VTSRAAGSRIFELAGGDDQTAPADLARLADLAAARWPQADASIREVRGSDQHFTYSKLMCWVAFDRALKIAAAVGLAGDRRRWQRARDDLRHAIDSRGRSDRIDAFAQTLSGDGLDAAELRLAQVGYLDPGDQRLRRTIAEIDRGLSEGPMVRRYRVEETHDGLSGGEGLFVMCGSWLVDALAHVGELEEAERRCERLLSFSSPLGLLAEEVDPGAGKLPGNYPQAFSHLALIAAAVNLERARNGRLGRRARELSSRPRRGVDAA